LPPDAEQPSLILSASALASVAATLREEAAEVDVITLS
jgi:hypothetical protein